ncbi:MAG: hypothetical protein M3041_03035 [Acidobacteriota bacterium]|nr:hypothetical protein [Acidobacteriota bacterium]
MSSRTATFALLALLVVIAGLAFIQSYQCWLDPIIDTGRDLYIPEQLGHGAKLYRDIRYQYPPLAPYLLAAATAVLGHSLASYTAIGLLQSIIIAAALWVVGRRTAGITAGFVASLFFVALSFCGASTWGANFLFPYSYAATIGMTLLMISLALFVCERPTAALVALFGASWCKVEYAIAALVILLILGIGRRISVRAIAAFAIGEAIAIPAALLYFPTLRENVFAEALTRGESARQFFRNVSGLALWEVNLATAALAIVGIVLIAWLLRSVRMQIAIPIVIIISVALASHAFFRAWGFLQFAALLQGFRTRNANLLTLSAFSIAATLRIPLSVSPAWYGFVLIVPTYALIAYVLFGYLRGNSIWWIPLIAFLCDRDLSEQRVRYALKAFPIVSTRGTFYDANSDRAEVLNAFIQRVHGGTLAVFPEGITLNYLTQSTTTLTFHTFTPVETAAAAVEDSIIGEFRQHPPDRIAIVDRDVTEYGYRGFGVDYNQRLFAYLTEKYQLEQNWAKPRFRLFLLRR